MNNRNLFILFVVTVAVVILTLVLHLSAGTKEPHAASGALLIQGFNPDLINKIVVSSDEETATLLRKNRGFVVAELQDYPAHTARINGLIINSLDIRIEEMITENPEIHGELGVEKGGADALEVTFFKDDGTSLAGFIRGKKTETGRGFYVRRHGENAVYRSDGHLSLNSSPINYVERMLTDVPRGDIEQVEVAVGDSLYIIAGDGEGNMELTDVPEGKEVKKSELNSVCRALDNLRLTDVLPAGALELQWDGQYIARLKSGLSYRVDSAEHNEVTFVRLSARAPDVERVTIGRSDTDQELSEKEAMLMAQEEARKFNSRHEDRLYAISNFNSQRLRKNLSELQEDIEPEPQKESDP